MGRSNRFGALGACLVGAAVALLMSPVAPVRAADADYGQKADTLGTGEPAEEEEDGPNRGRVSFTIGQDFTTAYFFRGILQERDGFIYQPYAEMAINLFEGERVLTSIDLGMGVWFSLQTEKTLASGSGPSNLYETDYYPSLSLGWEYGLTTSLAYVVYTGPNGSFNTIQQLDFGIAWDDSEVFDSPVSFGPSVTFSFELDNTSFGDKEGGYFELAAAPSIELEISEAAADYPITLAAPLALGLSMYDYYETATQDQTFGFFSFGANAGVPLAFIPSDFGSWSASLGINVLVLSDTLEEVNDGDSPFPVGVFSLVMEY